MFELLLCGVKHKRRSHHNPHAIKRAWDRHRYLLDQPQRDGLPVDVGRAVMQQPGAVAAVVALVAFADRESAAGQYAIQEGAAVAGAVDGGDRLGLRGCRTGPPERRRPLLVVVEEEAEVEVGI